MHRRAWWLATVTSAHGRLHQEMDMSLGCRVRPCLQKPKAEDTAQWWGACMHTQSPALYRYKVPSLSPFFFISLQLWFVLGTPSNSNRAGVPSSSFMFPKTICVSLCGGIVIQYLSQCFQNQSKLYIYIYMIYICIYISLV